MSEEDPGGRVKPEVLDNILGKTHHQRQLFNPLLFILGASQIWEFLGLFMGSVGVELMLLKDDKSIIRDLRTCLSIHLLSLHHTFGTMLALNLLP